VKHRHIRRSIANIIVAQVASFTTIILVAASEFYVILVACPNYNFRKIANSTTFSLQLLKNFSCNSKICNFYNFYQANCNSTTFQIAIQTIVGLQLKG
jgi:hypothetical protein